MNRFKRARVEDGNQAQPSGSGEAQIYDDYMADVTVFAAKEAKSSMQGYRMSNKRAISSDKGRVLSKKEIEVKMTVRREEGLQQEIGQENKGFQLLMKMGFRGGGLGKGGGGAPVPLAPVLKIGRGGLGKDAEVRRAQEVKKEQARQAAEAAARREVQHRQDFKGAMSQKFVDRQVLADLKKARCTTEDLDTRCGLERNVMWPDAGVPGDADEPGWAAADGHSECALVELTVPQSEFQLQWDALSPVEQLSCVTEYLRSRHLYCMFCGCGFSDVHDMSQSCPGATRADHDDDEEL